MPRNPPVLPPNQGPLSLVNTTSVLSSSFSSFNFGEHLANARIQFGDHVAVQTGAAFLVVLLRRRQRLVRHGVGEVEEEWLVLVPLDEFQRPIGVALRERRLHDRILDDLFAIDQLHGPHVVAVQNAEVLIEAAANGIELLLGVAEMPLADHAGGIAGAVKELGQRDFRRRQSQLGVLAAEIGGGVRRHAAAKRIATRHQRSARRCAERRRRIELREPRAFRGHPVEIRRLELRMPKARQVAVTEVVGQQDDDVGRMVGCRLATPQSLASHSSAPPDTVLRMIEVACCNRLSDPTNYSDERLARQRGIPLTL